MSEEPAEIQLLKSQKAKLIEILRSDADFILQHADSRFLLSSEGYERVKSCCVPTEKVTELLDHIIQRGPKAARGLLDLLKDEALYETFPRLRNMKDLQVNTLTPGKKKASRKTKRKTAADSQETISSKRKRNNEPRLVEEEQLMTVAGNIGKSWKAIGVKALGIPSVKLEQIEVDQRTHVDCVFAMLRYWRTSRREKATAAYLHTLLSEGDWALPPESLKVLLEED